MTETTIRAIIFDLDNCLASSKEVGEALFRPAFEAIRAENRGRLPDEALESAFADMWIHALDFVVQRHGFSPEMRRAGWEALKKVEVTKPMHGYGDLPLLEQLRPDLYLITSGFRRLQESKIRALGIRHLFKSAEVNAIDEIDHVGKERMFEEILEKGGYRPAEVLVVGDNPESEIQAGNHLGMPTVQTLRPEVERSDEAGHHVQGLQEILDRWG